jgi:chromosomal replication initiation ATPase DnaA
VIDALRVRDLLEIVEAVCKTRGVVLHELCGRARSQSVARARQEAWWRIRRHPERHYSLLEIARLFERDHATVIAGLHAHERRRGLASGSRANTQGDDESARRLRPVLPTP